jgi:amidase
MKPVHAFTDDILAGHDATALARLIADKEVTAAEVCEAAAARAERVQAQLNGVHHPDYEHARDSADDAPDGVFPGVPTFIKDNVDVAGLPTNHGTVAFDARPASHDSPFVTQLRSLGLVVLGKSRLPEFGFSASTEYVDSDPVRNPWDLDYSAGASSGGSASLVAAGVVPLAHANDGGGSIRIPAAACGLVGLKPTRGRFIADPFEKQMPVKIVSQGVVTRSVRDTARFFAGMEAAWRNPKLPPVRSVEGPGSTKLRVGMVLDSPSGVRTDTETRAAVEQTAELLESLGHRVEEVDPPVADTFGEDFAHYWGLLGFAITANGARIMDPGFDASKTDNLTRGLATMFRKDLLRTPGMLVRLRRSTRRYRRAFVGHDVILSPVLGHTTPEIGHLSPTLEFDVLFQRLQEYVGFTPINNTAGGPAMSLPLGRTGEGMPIGVHFSADLGDERTLLELAFALEEARPFARIQDAVPNLS